MPINVEKYRGFRVTKGDATGEQLAILVPTTYRVLHYASAADEDTDWNVCNPTHPTLYVHSETTPATDYLSIAHDGDRASLTVAGGTLQLAGGDVEIPNGTGLLIGHTSQITLNALIPELQVLGTTVGVDAAIAAVLYSSTAAEGAEIVLGRSKSATLGTNTIVASGDLLGRIVAVGADGSTGFDPAASIAFEVDATPGASADMPGRIVFLTSPDTSQTQTEVFRITSGQNLLVANCNGVVIGHTAQVTFNALVPEMQVLGNTVGVDGALAVGLYSSTAAEGPELILARSKSATLGTNTIVAANDSLGRIVAMGADGGSGFDPAAAINFAVCGTPGASTDMPGRIEFQTSPDSSQTPATRMTVLTGATTVAQVRIGTAGTSTGSLLITGATSGTVTISAAAAAGTYTLQLPADDGCCGEQLTTNGSGVLDWAAASMGEYKDDLGPVCSGEALQAVLATPVHHFKYNRDKMPAGKWAPDYPFVGVFGEESPHYMQGKNKRVFSPINSVGYLTAAVQALSAKVDALEGKRKA